jgi:hypothetical protein
MKNKRYLTRDELLAKLAAPPEQIVDVAGVGPVRIRVPDFQRLVALKSSVTGSEDEQAYALILASCPDLRPEDLDLLKRSRGMAIGALLSAIAEIDKPVTDETVGKHSRR